MNITKLTSFLILLPSFLVAQNLVDLEVKVTGIKKLSGKVRICLVHSKEDFLKNCYQSQDIKVGSHEVTAVFHDLEPKEYAISIYHDEDDNNELNSNFLGIPREDYGFSNNPKSMFGPPKYEKCTFQLKSNKQVVIWL
ncbi:MAG: DUF2141 domain-containing protein [Flavobacteriaceae bacterium]|nr:DUF2141 domain-containing protein [Bacteroidia bacterium]MBT8269128.1 DUF2141 domain-containing protein [Bacteroidia bacterium]NNF73670.1 DUF2141 domain-containing protein [Flavobacteriaceae bacterium]NNK69127.1 DUF2141 domain-containing protein [Flavobacteriaceae bacterium]